MEQLKATGLATPYEKGYWAKDGRLVPVQLGAVLIPAANVDATKDDIAVFFTDLTAQKKAEAALLQTEKIGAVGKLASAISHEMNNPLEAITNVLFIVRQMEGLPQGAKTTWKSPPANWLVCRRPQSKRYASTASPRLPSPFTLKCSSKKFSTCTRAD